MVSQLTEEVIREIRHRVRWGSLRQGTDLAGAGGSGCCSVDAFMDMANEVEMGLMFAFRGQDPLSGRSARSTRSLYKGSTTPGTPDRPGLAGTGKDK